VGEVRYLNAWQPDIEAEAEAYQALLDEMRARGVTVEQLQLPDSLLDLRAAPQAP